MSNSLGIDLNGKRVVLCSKSFKNRDLSVSERVVTVLGGFGANPSTMGRALFVKFECDGEECRWDSHEVERLATEGE